jgi:hypothetical protein
MRFEWHFPLETWPIFEDVAVKGIVRFGGCPRAMNKNNWDRKRFPAEKHTMQSELDGHDACSLPLGIHCR